MEIFGIGPMELVLVLLIALMVFGPDKLPEIGAKLGRGLRSVRAATHEFSREIEATRQLVEAPLNEIKQPLEELKAPITEITQPFQELKQPFRELGQSAQDLPVQAKEALTLAAGTVNDAVVAPPATGTSEDEPADTMAQDASAVEPGQGEAGFVSMAAEGPSEEPLTDADTGDGFASLPDIPYTAPVALDPAELLRLAVAVINPQEALRQVIARQMRPGNGVGE